jgi:signal transduction histidine kinase
MIILMKKIIITLVLCFGAKLFFAQRLDTTLLKQALLTTSNDTLKLFLLDSLSLAFSESNPQASLLYAEEEIEQSRRLKFKLNEAYAMNNKGYALLNTGNYPRALQTFLTGLQIAEDDRNEKSILISDKWSLAGLPSFITTPHKHRLRIIAWLHFNLGILYENVNNPDKEFFYYSRALKLGEEVRDSGIIGVTNMNLGRLYLSLKKNDSALLCEKKAYDISLRLNFLEYNGSVLLNLARVYLAMGDKQQAIEYLRSAVLVSGRLNYIRGVIAGNLLLASINFKDNVLDSGFYYANTALQQAIRMKAPDLLLRTYTAMADYYNMVKNNDSIVKYQSLIIRIKDSIFNSTQARQFQNIDFDEAQRQQELESAKKDYRNQLQKYSLIAGLAIFLFAVIVLWRNNRNKQKAFQQLKKQKEEIDFQKTRVEKALEDLKTTQSQLIQAEKMASLGELTAGIAHEIQNPLNFVNNFSELNDELLKELKAEAENGNLEEVKAIAKDIQFNSEKINHHGKRADAIVKGMLQHSRTNSGQKEPTDLNALANEYLRLAYHGFRAKDKTFNATLKTDFDESIGNINIIPQDIGRVILNLINNAFYAVDEKKKLGNENYEPGVTVVTRSVKPPPSGGGLGTVEIKVKDNGNGIPQKILDKIFQPFFSTKPTGQGTGLGLSLSYDIVKRHGGEIKVETKEGEGCEFIIQLPLNTSA